MLWTVAEHNIHGACARLAAWVAWLRTGTAAVEEMLKVLGISEGQSVEAKA